MTALSATASATMPAVHAAALLKLANGEYSSASVAMNPAEANRLGLVKMRDGNYATLLSASALGVPMAAAVRSSSDTLSAMLTLNRGG